MSDVNNVPHKFVCCGYTSTTTLNLPSDAGNWGLFIQTIGNGNDLVQFLINNSGGFALLRVRDGASNWGNWHTIYTDIPQFYKDYADLSSLASALGEINPFKMKDYTFQNVAKDGYVSIAKGGCALIIIREAYLNNDTFVGIIDLTGAIHSIYKGDMFEIGTGQNIEITADSNYIYIANRSDYTGSYYAKAIIV